jgi:hypothetical protein
MASRTKLKRLETRKARLIKQNDLHRGDLLDEADNLRDVATLIERGHSLYHATRKIRSWASPFSIFGRKKSSTMGFLWKHCAGGLKLLQHLRNR